MINCLSIVETDKVNHTVEIDIVIRVVKIESFGMSADELDMETRSSDGLQPKRADLSYVHALNGPYLHEIQVVPSTHEANQVLKIDWLSCVETDKVIHTMETDIVKHVVKIESFGMSFDDFDKETVSFDELQLKQADLSCIHALSELHLHEIHVVPSKHKADQY
nr:hypothetical protein [Tanacetum cinerariifolium]